MQLFGILNITPDSFSDGGFFLQEQNAILHAQSLAKKCFAVDVGSQSTKPNAQIISTNEEITRLGNVLKEISQFSKVSIDTFNFETQKFAINQGVSYINDVSAFKNPEIFKIAPQNVSFVFMHHLTIPANKEITMQTQKNDMIKEIKQWAMQKIEEYSVFGIQKNRLIFDVGIGFGKDAGQSLYIIEHIEEFLSLGVQIMLGHSRKSFIDAIKPNASLDEKDEITQQITSQIAQKDIHFARVHKP